MTPELTAEKVYQDTRDDLAGLNGDEARQRMLLGLVTLQAHQMMDQLRLFGVHGAKVLNLGGSVLIANP